MRNKFPLFKILILVTILAVPGFLYYLLQAKGKNRYKPLPVYGPKELSGTFTTRKGDKIPDTLYHKVADLQALTQDSAAYSLAQVEKKIVILNLFDPENTLLTQKSYEKIDWLFNEYQDNELLRFVSVNVNPDVSVSEINRFAEQHGKSPRRVFLQVDTATVFPWAKQQLFVNAYSAEDKIIYSDKLVLLDADHRIRGYYSSTNAEDMKKMNDEIKVMIAEELRKIK